MEIIALPTSFKKTSVPLGNFNLLVSKPAVGIVVGSMGLVPTSASTSAAAALFYDTGLAA